MTGKEDIRRCPYEATSVLLGFRDIMQISRDGRKLYLSLNNVLFRTKIRKTDALRIAHQVKLWYIHTSDGKQLSALKR